MLLPEAIHHDCGCDALVATDDEASRRVIGAVAVSPMMRRTPRPGPNVALHVIEPWRRRGVGGALLNAAANLAAARGAQALYAWKPLNPEGVETPSWRGLGFDQVINCPLNRIDATRTVELLQPLYDRLQRRGEIPEEARMVCLQEANPDEVVDLATTYLAASGARGKLKDRVLGRHPAPLDPILSRVLLHRERVVGVMLGRPVHAHTALVEVNVVHPAVRGRWANVWLKLDATSRARDLGLTTFIYETYQHHADTAKLTSRLDGVLAPRVELYRIIATSPR